MITISVAEGSIPLSVEVSTPCERAMPEPTGLCDRNVFPEAFFDRLYLSWCWLIPSLITYFISALTATS